MKQLTIVGIVTACCVAAVVIALCYTPKEQPRHEVSVTTAFTNQRDAQAALATSFPGVKVIGSREHADGNVVDIWGSVGPERFTGTYVKSTGLVNITYDRDRADKVLP